MDPQFSHSMDPETSSRSKIVHFGILIHVLSWRQKTKQMFVMITENFWHIFWPNFWQPVFDAVQNSSFCLIVRPFKESRRLKSSKKAKVIFDLSSWICVIFFISISRSSERWNLITKDFLKFILFTLFWSWLNTNNKVDDISSFYIRSKNPFLEVKRYLYSVSRCWVTFCLG